MDILSKIKQPVEGEMIQLNEIIAHALSSTSPLLSRVVAHYLTMAGKQIRPILVLLTGRLMGEVKPETLHGAAAIELLHNATLIHDDVVDESKLRRGKATINGIWDNRVAVLAGDYFVSCALESALRTHSVEVVRILGLLGRMLASGEMEQLSVVQSKIIDEKAYFNVIRQKTASLFISCMQVGAITSGMSAEQSESVKNFGERLGLCFQIKDDIFDYFAQGEVGKPTRSDLAEGKVTLPLIYALTHEQGAHCDAMRALLQKDELTDDDITRLIAFAVDHGGVAYAEQVMYRLRDEAAACLAPFASSPVVDSLMAVFDYVISRTK